MVLDTDKQVDSESDLRLFPHLHILSFITMLQSPTTDEVLNDKADPRSLTSKSYLICKKEKVKCQSYKGAGIIQ